MNKVFPAFNKKCLVTNSIKDLVRSLIEEELEDKEIWIITDGRTLSVKLLKELDDGYRS